MDDTLRAWVEETAGGRDHRRDPSRGRGSRGALLRRRRTRRRHRRPARAAVRGRRLVLRHRDLTGQGSGGVPRARAHRGPGAARHGPRSRRRGAVDGTGRRASATSPRSTSPSAPRRWRSFVDALAALHNLDVDTLALDGFARPQRRGRPRRVSISRCGRSSPTTAWSTSIRSCATRARGCARTRRPTSTRTVLVQGDTGPGNFVFENGKVTGIVDWEFAHVGDPMDDWAWLDMRMPRRRSRRAPGSVRTGDRASQIDHERIRYYRAAVDYRCAVTTSLAVSRGGGARGGRRTCSSPSATCSGSPTGCRVCSASSEPAELPVVTPTARTPLYDHLLDGIRAATRGVDDVDAAREHAQPPDPGALPPRLRRDRRRHRGARPRRPRRRRSAPTRSTSRASPRSSNRPAPTADEPMFRYLLRRTQRERLLWATLLDRPRRPNDRTGVSSTAHTGLLTPV